MVLCRKCLKRTAVTHDYLCLKCARAGRMKQHGAGILCGLGEVCR